MYHVMCRGRVIGSSKLEHADQSMGVALGVFQPAPDYATVQSVFRLFTDAGKDAPKLRLYFEARDALGLTLVNERGNVVPTNAIHVYDFEGLEPELEVHIGTPEFWQEWRGVD